MAKQITILTITGSSPYDVWICNNSFSQCVYIDTISQSQIPYSFKVPDQYLSLTQVGVEVKDFNKCIIRNTVNL